MVGQLCWLPKAQGQEEKILHLRMQPDQPWYPYTACSQFALPDYRIPGGSWGWATYQNLLQAGWTLVPNTELPKYLLQVQTA